MGAGGSAARHRGGPGPPGGAALPTPAAPVDPTNTAENLFAHPAGRREGDVYRSKFDRHDRDEFGFADELARTNKKHIDHVNARSDFAKAEMEKPYKPLFGHLTNKDVAAANMDRDREKRAAAIAAGVDPRLLPELPRHAQNGSAPSMGTESRRERKADLSFYHARERDRQQAANQDRERKVAAHALAVVNSSLPLRTNIPPPVSPMAGNGYSNGNAESSPPSLPPLTTSNSTSSLSSLHHNGNGAGASRAKRAGSYASPISPLAKWTCEQCTYDNDLLREECELCVRRRPTTPHIIRLLARVESQHQQPAAASRTNGAASSPTSPNPLSNASSATMWTCAHCLVENAIDVLAPDAPCSLCDRARPPALRITAPPSPAALPPMTAPTHSNTTPTNSRGNNNNNVTPVRRAFPSTSGFEVAIQPDNYDATPLTAPPVLIRAGTTTTSAGSNRLHTIHATNSHRRTASTGTSTAMLSTSAAVHRQSLHVPSAGIVAPASPTAIVWRCPGCSMDNLAAELHCTLCNEPRSAPAAVVTKPPISPFLLRKASVATPVKRAIHLGPGITVLNDGTSLLDISSVTVEGLRQLPKRLTSSNATSLIISQLDKSSYINSDSQLMNAFVALIPLLPACLVSLDASGVKSKKSITHAFADLITRPQCMLRHIKLLLDRDMEGSNDQERVSGSLATPSPSVFARNMEMNHTIQSLDLSGSVLGASVGFRLAESLMDNITITNLDLSDCQLGASGGKIAEMLKKNKHITVCDLSANDIGEPGARRLCDCLLTNSTLTRLGVADNGFGATALELLFGYTKHNTSLTDLNLRGNLLFERGMSFVARNIAKSQSLFSLDISDCNLALASRLVGLIIEQNRSLTKLNISGNSFGHIAGRTIVESLMGHRGLLRSIDLSNTGMNGTCGLLELVVERPTMSISFGDNPLTTAESAAIQAELDSRRPPHEHRLPFLMGMHARLGAASSVMHALVRSVIFDRQTILMMWTFMEDVATS